MVSSRVAQAPRLKRFEPDPGDKTSRHPATLAV